MVNISRKVLISLMVIPVIIVIVAIAAWLDIGGFGTAIAGVGGPFAAGLYSIISTPFAWSLSGGWPTLAAGLAVILFLMAFSAFIVWHYDLPYKITGATAPNPANGYTNTMNKEPAEPERAPSVVQPTPEKGK